MEALTFYLIFKGFGEFSKILVIHIAIIIKNMIKSRGQEVKVKGLPPWRLLPLCEVNLKKERSLGEENFFVAAFLKFLVFSHGQGCSSSSW